KTAIAADLQIVRASNGAFKGTEGDNDGFYVLGPVDDNSKEMDAATSAPAVTTKCTLYVKDDTLGKGRMYYTMPKTTDLTQPLPKHAVLLRRLACPGMAPQEDKTMANYNPYITVDYLAEVPTFDGVEVTDMAAHNPSTKFTERYPTGKYQPYASELTTQLKQMMPTGVTGQIQHTFFRHNSKDDPANAGTPMQTIKMPFDWLVHLDRQLVSPMELLQVSGFKPHELTQQFMQPDATNSPCGEKDFAHRVPWFDDQARLYRVFEFLETKNRCLGVDVGGRIPGRVNINTIWDLETIQAICDRQQVNLTNGFDDACVTSAYNALMLSRTPNHAALTLGTTDRPFRSLCIGYSAGGDPQYGTNGSGINDTLLRADVATGTKTNPRLLDGKIAGNPHTHPYLRTLLLNKIYNNLTTRSNVFAVWLTVGYFEVVDDTKQPVKLGAELDAAIGKNKRHHMFAIVDRTAVSILNAAPIATCNTVVNTPGIHQVTASADISAQVKGGTILTLGDGVDRETVQVLKMISNTTFEAKFLKPHRTANYNIYANTLGNPGPQPTFVPRDNGAVVPYYIIID
ncbi:MAG: hypothetical protein AB7K24_12500, partial [Gemmataceae bacterium]